jgi:LysM repeat protein
MSYICVVHFLRKEPLMHGSIGRRFGVILAIVVLLGALLTPAAAAESYVVHVVQRGETLSTIAYRYGVGISALAAANGIGNWNLIYVGQRLRVPTAPGPQPPPAGRVHIVRWGETLNSIARLYGVNVWALAQTNGIWNLNLIYVGQRLIIPGGPPPPPPPPAPTSWQAQYWNTRDLTGPVALSRYETDLSYNWGGASPGPGVGSVNWSARWTRSFYMTGGTYRITVRVDDGVRLYIDNTPIIDAWQVQAATTYQRDVILVTGNHTFTVEYFQAEGVSELNVSSQKL